MAVHVFPTSGDAYDGSQCGANYHADPATLAPVDGEDEYDWPQVNTGDTIVGEEDEVVGVSNTWPIAVTLKPGALHYTTPHTQAVVVNALYNDRFVGCMDRDTATAAVAAAVAEATRRGWPVIPA